MKGQKINYDFQLLKEYYNKGFTNMEVKAITGYTFGNLEHICKVLEIKYPRYKNLELTEENEQVLIGSLLGDATIALNKTKNSQGIYVFTHSLAQKEYALWKHSVLSNLPFKWSIFKCKSPDPRNGNIYEGVRVFSQSNPLYTEYRRLFYNTGTKQVSKEIIEKIKPLGLAVWFMDDGYKSQYGYYLSTNSFNIISCNIIKDYLKSEFNLTTTIDSKNRIYIHSTSAKIFRSIVEPYIHPTLKYKLELKGRKRKCQI